MTSNIKIIVGVYDTVNKNIEKLSSVFDTSGADLTDLLSGPVITQAANSEKLHIYCSSNASDCRVGATLTNETNRYLHFSRGTKSIETNNFTSGSLNLGASFMWCTAWNSNALLSNNMSTYSQSGIGMS